MFPDTVIPEVLYNFKIFLLPHHFASLQGKAASLNYIIHPPFYITLHTFMNTAEYNRFESKNSETD